MRWQAQRISRRLLPMAVLVFMAGFVAQLKAANNAVALQSSCIVTTASGDVQGLDLGASCAFLGIPYAAPPVGNLGWKPPHPNAPWAPMR